MNDRSGKAIKAVKIAPKDGTLDFKDTPAFAVSYLKTYYHQPPTADETAVSKFLIEEFKTRPPQGRFLELGCGPTIHHIFPFARFVDEIHMADYLDDNLEQVRLWKEQAPGAHDWGTYAGLNLRFLDGKEDPNEINLLQKISRSKIASVFTCDLKQSTPDKYKGKFDAVGCFYCAEEIGITNAEWRKVIARVVDYIAPGGTLYMAALASMNHYQVVQPSGITLDYPCAYITEEVVNSALKDLGFSNDNIRLKTNEIDHPDCGLTGTLILAADKS